MDAPDLFDNERIGLRLEPVVDRENTEVVGKCNLVIPMEIKRYERFRYTTNLSTLNLIFQNHTFRSNNLTYARLNDRMEMRRNGIEPLAACRYITCFSHDEHEAVPFWVSYGMDDKEEKVQLCFNNFANDFQEKIYMDYALIANNMKIFYHSDEYGRAVNQNGIIGTKLGLPRIHTDFNLNNSISNVSMFDIQYIPTDDPEFTRQYSGEATIEVGGETVPAIAYDTATLGRKKSNPWEYEHETRIMVSLKGNESVGEWIDLRLKDEIFRDLIIIKSPWEDNSLQGKIENIIRESTLPEDVKASIVIKESEVKGTLNF